MDDPRFKRFSTDPKFRVVPKKERKVKIDPRFKSMFNDKRFVDKVDVDKRGRPKSFATKENFEKFYQLESSSENDEDDDEAKIEEKKDGKKESKKLKKKESKTIVSVKNKQTETKKGKKSKKLERETEKKQEQTETKKGKKSKKMERKTEKKEEQSEAESESDDDDKIISKLQKDGIDYARGEGVLLSDSSSDDSSDDEDEQEGEECEPAGFDKWGELDDDAESTEDSTKRLAVCNMDWDRVGAQDIFVALNSFCPPGGSVKSVSVYLSEFGKERLEEEDVLGPRELREGANLGKEAPDDSFENFDDDGEMDQETIERIRTYQINRLKYYYAVAEFSSIEAADKVYQECDGMEYELSATRFDLRFIPEEMSFDQDPKETCDHPPRPEDYKPKIFINTALKQGKVNLTWDETDPNRLAAMRKAFDAASDDDDDEDVKAYLANSSDDDEDGQTTQRGLAPFGADEDDFGSSENDEDVVNKYKALLGEIKEKEKKSNSETDMQVSWIPSDVVSEKAKQKELEAMTPWEQYLEKKKEKRKAKKLKSKKVGKSEEETEDPEKPFSDDELPDGFDPDDPFFKTMQDEGPSKEKGKKNKKMDKNKGKKNSAKAADESTDKTALSLLLMESDDDRDHFDYKEIVKNETKKAKKKKNKAKRDQEKKDEDTFKIDLSDDRFSAIYRKAEYNVDPSNPNFKKTKSMSAFIEEKQRRRTSGAGESSRDLDEEPPASKKSKKSEYPVKTTSSLDQLVHNVKAKSNRMKIANKK